MSDTIGTKRKYQSNISGSNDISIESKYLDLHALTSELISKLKCNYSDYAYKSLVDPIVALEISILKGRINDLQNEIHAILSRNPATSSIQRGDPKYQIIMLEDKVKQLTASNDELQSTHSDAAIQKYKQLISTKDRKLYDLHCALAEANVAKKELEQENQKLAAEIMILKNSKK